MIWSNTHNRLVPELGPEHYKSYSLSAPLKSHWKKATCEEYECDEFVYGYVLTLYTGDSMFEERYYYLTHDKTRKHSMQRVSDACIKFIYGPGNDGMGQVHAEHRVPIGRPPFLIVAEGDFRGNPRGTRPLFHRRVEDWIDDSANQFDRLRTALQQG
jgi:hypothetical protein